MKLTLPKLNWKQFSVVALALLVAFGIYNNPDRKTAQVDAELQEIFTAMDSTLQEVAKTATENKTCFEDESLTEESAECVINLRDIQSTFRTVDKENVVKLETYFETNQASLDEQTKKMIRDSLRLYKSDAYSALMTSYDNFFTTYIEWHKYFRDYVGVKGVDGMNSEELMQAHYLAEDIVEAEENLELKKNAFSDYLRENFDKEFVDALNAYATGLK